MLVVDSAFSLFDHSVRILCQLQGSHGVRGTACGRHRRPGVSRARPLRRRVIRCAKICCIVCIISGFFFVLAGPPRLAGDLFFSGQITKFTKYTSVWVARHIRVASPGMDASMYWCSGCFARPWRHVIAHCKIEVCVSSMSVVGRFVDEAGQTFRGRSFAARGALDPGRFRHITVTVFYLSVCDRCFFSCALIKDVPVPPKPCKRTRWQHCGSHCCGGRSTGAPLPAQGGRLLLTSSVVFLAATVKSKSVNIQCLFYVPCCRQGIQEVSTDGLAQRLALGRGRLRDETVTLFFCLSASDHFVCHSHVSRLLQLL